MGALSRATRVEIVELVAGDPQWWSGFCAKVVEVGPLVAIREERELRGWAEGAFRQWLRADEGRYAEFEAAMRDHADIMGWQTKEVAFGEGEPADKKVKIDTLFKLAGKVNRPAWGESIKQDGGGVVVLDAGLVLEMGALLAKLGPAQLVIEAQQSVDDADVI